MMIKRLLIFCGLLSCFAFTITTTQDRLQEKFDKAIKSTYEVKDYQLESITALGNIEEKIPAKTAAKNLSRISVQGELIGYTYLGTAPSKKKKFEYVVLFDKDLKIKKSKVLIYREDYGLQIGSQRWLKQFIGMTPDSKVEYGGNIAAISGATISASSMARAVNNVLKTMHILKQENQL
ncbi:FMN-binding protein [Mesonia sp. K4-1]|nr:FMN-binding protein [Mesonia sp. K4-1]